MGVDHPVHRPSREWKCPRMARVWTHLDHQVWVRRAPLLTKPPDGKPHPTFLHKNPQEKAELNNVPPQTAKSTYLRRTISTLYRMITGHAFIGAYAQRFLPQHTPEQIACPCGERIQTIKHVLRDCPQYDTTRRRHLTANSRPRNISQMFNHPKRVHSLLRFLEETGVCAKPQTQWDPG